jgi:hypothetical protein
MAAVALSVAIPFVVACFLYAAVRLPLVATPKHKKQRTTGTVFSLQSLTQKSAWGNSCL